MPYHPVFRIAIAFQELGTFDCLLKLGLHIGAGIESGAGEHGVHGFAPIGSQAVSEVGRHPVAEEAYALFLALVHIGVESEDELVSRVGFTRRDASHRLEDLTHNTKKMFVTEERGGQLCVSRILHSFKLLDHG